MRLTPALRRIVQALFVVVIAAPLAACPEPIGVEIRRQVEVRGEDGARAYFLQRAERGGGKDLYVYWRFLGRPRRSRPVNDAPPDPYADGVLNCAASAGDESAIGRAYWVLKSRATPEAAGAAACLEPTLENHSQRPRAWVRCGGARLLPACPLHIRRGWFGRLTGLPE